jgi:hypothetical protein
MSGLLDADGKPINPASRGLFDVGGIARMAASVLVELQNRASRFDEMTRLSELRRSCGVEPEPLTIRVGIKLPRDYVERKP